LINKTFSQLNTERAARRAQYPKGGGRPLRPGPKLQAASAKLQEGIDYEVDNIDDYIKRVKSNKRLETDTIKK